MMRPSSLLAAAFLAVAGLPVLATQPAAAQDEGCPEHAAPVSESDNVVHCRCVSGYENKDGVCKAVVAAPLPVLRAQDNVAEKISGLCRELDDERQEMAKIDLKVAMLNLEALAKLFHIETGIEFVRRDGDVYAAVGVPENAEEPPEEVLREGSEHLKKIIELNEEIDELNGKRAWSEAERKWVLGHIYIATPESKYAVNTSDAAAHGQTAFSDLRDMPAFDGCKRPATGRPYIPQY